MITFSDALCAEIYQNLYQNLPKYDRHYIIMVNYVSDSVRFLSKGDCFLIPSPSPFGEGWGGAIYFITFCPLTI